MNHEKIGHEDGENKEVQPKPEQIQVLENIANYLGVDISSLDGIDAVREELKVLLDHTSMQVRNNHPEGQRGGLF